MTGPAVRIKRITLGIVMGWPVLAAAAPMLAPGTDQVTDGGRPRRRQWPSRCVPGNCSPGRSRQRRHAGDRGAAQPEWPDRQRPRRGAAHLRPVERREPTGRRTGSGLGRDQPQAAAGLRSEDGTTTMIVTSLSLDPADPAFGRAVDTIKTIGLVLVLLLAIYRSPVLAAVPLLAAPPTSTRTWRPPHSSPWPTVAMDAERAVGLCVCRAGLRTRATRLSAPQVEPSWVSRASQRT